MKKTIMLFDVPAESGGALSVLRDFYEEICAREDKNIFWIFVLGNVNLPERENIKVLNFPWIKKSWGHRLYFDYIIAPRLVKKFNVDKIFSMQNIVIPLTDIDQITYMHQSLPFCEFKFKIYDDFRLWIYQNIIGKMIVNSIKRSKKVIVQTEWIKAACVLKTGASPDNILVINPKVNVPIIKENNYEKNDRAKFFYPASGEKYKNHEILIEACKILKKKNIVDYEVILTLTKSDNDLTRTLHNDILFNDLPIKLIGCLTREQVFENYLDAVLLFPSYIETFGLPLLEARLHNAPIIASDTLFAKEILKGYRNADFFNYDDSSRLSNIMESYILKNKKRNSVKDNFEIKNESLVETVIGI